MKMSLVVRDWNDRILRAALPGEVPEDPKFAILRHYPAHWANMDRGRGMERVHQKESVQIQYGVYHPKEGKFDRIRRLPATALAMLEEVDAQREELEKKLREIKFLEQSILTSHYDRSTKLKMTEVRGFKSHA